LSPRKCCKAAVLRAIAHRQSTIEKADRIVVLQKGKIVEFGTHRELLTLGGVYAQLHRIRFEWGETVRESDEAVDNSTATY
jgi:ABC-type multidrug transport system fused ATPase/permease subunit